MLLSSLFVRADRVRNFLQKQRSSGVEAAPESAVKFQRAPSSENPTSSSALAFPSVGWRTLQAGRVDCPFFTVNSILVLFLDTTQNDGKSNANFKAVVGDCKAIRLFQAGYVSKILLVRVGDKVFFRAQSQPEMKSSADYQIAFVVKSAPCSYRR